MAVVTTNLGTVTAYGDAVAAGYTGTKAQWQALMADYATVGTQAAQDAQTASTAAQNASTAAQTATTKANEASQSAQAAQDAADAIGTPDTTLTQAGKAADAKATGDEISELKSGFNGLAKNIGSFVAQTDLQDVVTINNPKSILGVDFDLVANQSGSGDPSPTNVRTITAQTGATLKHSGDDTTNPDLISIGTGTVYNAHVDTASKTVTETATLIDLSSLSWSYQAAVSAFYVNMTALPSVSDKGSNASDFFGMCDTYKFVPYRTLNSASGLNTIAVRNDSSAKRLYVKTEGQDVTPTGYALLDLATPSTSSMLEVNITPKEGVNKLWIDGGDISVAYAIDVKEYVDDKSERTDAEMSALDIEVANISSTLNTYIDDSNMQTAFANVECVRGTYYTGYIHKYGTDTNHILNKNTLKYPYKVRVRCKTGYDFGVEELDKEYAITGNIAVTSIRSSNGQVTDYICNANANILIILRKPNGTIADVSEWSDALEISIYPGDFYDFAKNVAVPVYTTPSDFDVATLYTETSESQRVAQGMCTDGTYLYCSYQTAASSSYPTDIIKIDIATGTEVTRAQGMYGHANDICYDPTNDYILVMFTTATSVMMRFNASDLSYVDTIDLTSIATGINANYGFVAITYMPEYGRYVFGVANGNTLVGFAYMLTDFTLERFVKIMPMTYVQQNIDYISGMIVVSQYNPSNRIVFYSFDGKVIASVPAPTGLELESVAITNGIYYVLYNLDAYSKLQIYACTPVSTVDTPMALVQSQYVPY